MRRAPHVDGLPQESRSLVMGVLNVTPDSFSDGGRWTDHDAAVAHGLVLLEAGADMVEVGGESTRPGADRTCHDEEQRRVIPVIEALAAGGAIVSVDTMRAQVAADAVAAGARMINDVSGGQADPDMLPLAAELDLPFVCMHWRGHAAVMQRMAAYGDVVEDVLRELSHTVDVVLAAGVKPSHLIVDPGLGYAKTSEHSWTLLRALDQFIDLGYPLLLAASRKSFLGNLLTDHQTGLPRPVYERDDATAAVSMFAALAGAWCIRVHEPAATADAVRVAAHLKKSHEA